MEKTIRKTDAIEARMIADASKAYDRAVAGVLRKHGAVIQRMKVLEKAEKYEQARVLARSSGLLDDLADAIASAGDQAAKLIRQGLMEVKAVMADDDG